MIFELDNVELYFKNKQILSGIYLKAETGKVTGILGGNGSGKSCLLEIAFGNLNPKYKLVRIDNKPIVKPLYLTKIVKYLPQYSFILNHIKLYKALKKFNLEWADFTTIFPEFDVLKEYRFGKLSGGERRLIETYIILKSASELVLLDEPFSYLSPLNIELVKTLIHEEKKNKAIVITDHMYRQIIDISDDIYLLKNRCTQKVNNLKDLEAYRYLSEGTLSQY